MYLKILSMNVVCGFIIVLTSGKALANETDWQKSVALGDTELERQKIVSAEGYFQQAVKAVELVSHNTDDLVTCLNKLANTLSLQHKTDLAETTYQRSLNILEKAYGQKSKKLIPTLLALGSTYEASGDHASAMKLYHRVMDLSENHFRPYNPAVASETKHLALATHHSATIAETKEQYGPESLVLSEQAGLAASRKLLHRVEISNDKDMLSEEDNSDKNLIADFQREITKASTISSKNITFVPRWSTSRISGQMDSKDIE